jgi:hypothetical protein
MERLGFTRDPEEDFLYPLLPEESPLRPHVLYRKKGGRGGSQAYSGKDEKDLRDQNGCAAGGGD